MKVLIVAHTSFNQIGGHERYTHQLANAMATSLGRRNVILWPIEQKIPLKKIDKQAYSIVHPVFYKNIWLRKFIHRYLLLKGITHIIADAAHLSPYVNKLANCFGRSYSVTTHGIEVWGQLLYGVRESLLNAHLVLTVSKFTKNKLLENGINPEKIRILTNHVDTDIFYPDCEGASRLSNKYTLHGKKVILTVCRLDDKEGYKGYDRVIRSMPVILSEIPNAVYIIVGEGPDRKRIEQMINEMNLSKKIILPGRVPDDDLLRAYYSACDVFVMPSQTVISDKICKGEGFGIVYIEANACGKPVVAGNGGGETDAVIDGVTGMLVNPMNVKDIARAIIRLLKDEELSHQLGQQGLCRVREEFNLSSLQKKVDAYIEDMERQNSDLD